MASRRAASGPESVDRRALLKHRIDVQVEHQSSRSSGRCGEGENRQITRVCSLGG